MTTDVKESSYLSLRDKCRKHVNSTIKRMEPIVRSWYLSVALDFMNSRKFTTQDEAFMEEISDFYLEKLDSLK